MRERKLKLEHEGITKERYTELLWASRQYEQLKAAERRRRNGEYDRTASGNTPGRGHSDPTASEAMRLATGPYAWKIAAIEQSAIAADSRLCKWILKNVTQGITYENMDVPCGRAQFYAARKNYFVELDKRI